MFVTNCGISQRPPLQWPEQIHMAAVYFPYVVTLDSEALRVYSILDQQQKQLIPFQKGCILVSSQGKYEPQIVSLNHYTQVVFCYQQQQCLT